MRASCLLFFLFISTWHSKMLPQSHVDSSTQKIPLKQHIVDLSERFDVNFSYVEETIENIYIEPHKNHDVLKGGLRYLEFQTGLVFEPTDSNNIIVYPNRSEGASICGTIYKLNSNSPLQGVRISVLGKGNYVSQENGYFEIFGLAENDKILVQHDGYPSQELSLKEFDPESCRDIFMSSQINQLQEVVVVKNKDVKYGNGKILIDTNGKTNLSTASSLEPDSFELIKWMPAINYGNESVSDLQIRGGSPDHNLVVYDGIRLFGTEHLFGAFSFVNPYLTESIQLDRGLIDPKYGNRLAGLLKIDVASGVFEKDEHGVNLSGTNANVFFKERLGNKMAMVGSFRHSINVTRDGQYLFFEPLIDRLFEDATDLGAPMGGDSESNEDPDPPENSGDVDFNFYDTFLKLIYQPTEQDTLSVSGLFSRNNFNFSGISEQRVFSDDHEVKNMGGSFKWVGAKGKRLTHSLEMNYSNFKSKYFGMEPDQMDYFVTRDYAIQELGFDVHMNYKIAKKYKLQLGYQYSSNKVTNDVIRNRESIAEETNSSILLLEDLENQKIDNSTLYAGVNLRPIDELDVNFALRNTSYSSSSLNELVFEPILSIGYGANHSRVNVAVSRRHQSISQLIQNNDRALRFENELWVIADSVNIPLLKSDQIAAGYTFEKGNWIMDFDVFYKYINGVTTLSRSFINETTGVFGRGNNKIFGIGMLIGKRIGKFNANLAYTYNDSKISYDDFQTSFPANNDIPHILKLGNSYSTENWQFSLGFIFRSGAPFTEVANFTLNNGDRSVIEYAPTNAARLPNYHRLDFSALHKFKLFGKDKENNAALGISLNNIYNSRIVLRETYQLYFSRNVGGDLNRLRLVSQGFSPNFIFRYIF